MCIRDIYKTALVRTAGNNFYGLSVYKETGKPLKKFRAVRPGLYFYLAAYSVGIYYFPSFKVFLLHNQSTMSTLIRLPCFWAT